jgi:transcriptional regulator with XRE-family HTH domain
MNLRLFDHSKIRSRRECLKLSQEELASNAGLTREHLIEIEKGRSVPRANMIAKIAVALKVKESYFFVDAVR